MILQNVLFPLVTGLIALLAAGYFIISVMKRDKGTEKMQAIARAIQEGSSAYLKREYKTIAIFIVIIALIFFFGFQSASLALTFVGGAVLSALAGAIGMAISVRANVRTAAAAKHGIQAALDTAFKGGAVTGMFVVGLALLGVTGMYLWYGDPIKIIGFGFGASLISLFARIGGGIYTKAADVGADLVGKVEKNIPEDDPRNPATIADNVGDNVGDCAGMAADLFETYAVTLIGAMLLGSLVVGPKGVMYPLQIAGGAVIASLIGMMFVRGKRSIMAALYKGLVASAIVAIAIFYLLLEEMIFYNAVVGIIAALLFFVITEHYTSLRSKSVKEIAESGQSGPATVIINGLAVGLRSTWMPTLVIVAAILSSFWIGGIYGIAIAVTAMLSLTGMIIAMDSYGPITDNAGGIAEMANLPKDVRQVTDALDAVGNTTKAVTKSYAIGSAALAALTLFAAFTQDLEIARQAAGAVGVITFTLSDPLVLTGLLIGSLIPFVFSSMAMAAVGRGAFSVVEEVRRQFKDGQIMKGKRKPDYAKTVDIVTSASLREMVGPALLAVLAPIIVGLLFGFKALGGLLMGSILSGFMLAIFMTTGGAAWDNAKKYVEDGNLGGKGGAVHKATVVGDTVGDPTKDTAGPAINPLIKVMNMIAIIAIPLIVAYALL
ncbi:MAG: sodium-translocating pyrophosphatase [Nanoarchaeota archaeon]|nr:sodium-translocating pyrophosphatase [Nanoarchaeota archaeon]